MIRWAERGLPGGRNYSWPSQARTPKTDESYAANDHPCRTRREVLCPAQRKSHPGELSTCSNLNLSLHEISGRQRTWSGAGGHTSEGRAEPRRAGSAVGVAGACGRGRTLRDRACGRAGAAGDRRSVSRTAKGGGIGVLPARTSRSINPTGSTTCFRSAPASKSLPTTRPHGAWSTSIATCRMRAREIRTPASTRASSARPSVCTAERVSLSQRFPCARQC